MADDLELEGIKVRADALRQLGITDPHVVDYEYRLWMVERLRKVGEVMAEKASRNLPVVTPDLAKFAPTVSICAGMMFAMATMLAEEGKRKMAEAQKSEAVEKETRAGKGGDETFEVKGDVLSQSASGAAVMFKRQEDGRLCWLPKSQIVGTGMPSVPGGYPFTATLTIPRWLAEKKGLLG